MWKRRRIERLPRWSPPAPKHPSKVDPFKGRRAKARQWTGWKLEARGEETGKKPFRTKSNDPTSWRTRKEARRERDANELDGIGIYLAREPDGSHLCGFDLDSCYDKSSRKCAPWAREFMAHIESYWEKSPSGTGYKSLFLVSDEDWEEFRHLVDPKRKKFREKWTKLGHKGVHPPAIEVYAAGQYFAVTAKHVKGTPKHIKRVPIAALRWACKTAGPALAEYRKLEAPKHKDLLLLKRGTNALTRLRKAGRTNPQLAALLRDDRRHIPGADKSRSVVDFCLVGFCKDLGFSKSDTRAAIYAHPFGAGCEKHDAGDQRYFARIWSKARSGGTSKADDRIIIRVRPGHLGPTVDAAQEALTVSGQPVYQRGDYLVMPARTTLHTASGQAVIVHNLRNLSPLPLTEALERSARFRGRTGGKPSTWKNIDCPQRVANAMLQRKEWKLPTLIGIINAPTVRANGTILDRPGYDEHSKLIYDPRGISFPPVPEAPNKAAAEEAVQRLQDLLHEFPFVTAADAAVGVSSIVSAIARPGIPTTPLHAATAPMPGNGKSYLVDLATVVATGSPCPVISQGKTMEESEKRLAASLIAGNPVISIDNCEIELGGSLLSTALTSHFVDLRVLGLSKLERVPNSAMLFATGNNLTLSADLARRLLLCTLDSKLEHPERRTFERDVCAHALENRGQYVVDCLTILRAYQLAGTPLRGQVRPLASFDIWSKIVREAIVWAGCADPVQTQEAARARDPIREALIALMTPWSKLFSDRRVTVKEVIERAKSENPGKWEQRLRDAIDGIAGQGDAISGKRLGTFLSKHVSRVVGGQRFEKHTARGGVAAWRLVG